MKTDKPKKRAPGRAANREPGNESGRSHARNPRRAPNPTREVHRGRPMLFRDAFDTLWELIFSSPIHLDSALSKSPPSQKSALAEMTMLLLQRPRSLGKYLRFQLNDDEPWGLDGEALANWGTIRAMAHRLFLTWSRDPEFANEGHPIVEDYPPWLINEWRKDYGDKVTKDLVDLLGRRAPLSLRATRMKGRDEVLSAVNDSREMPIRARTSSVTPFGFFYPVYTAVMGHPLFKAGQYEIQDEGSQIMSLFALWPETFIPMLRKVPGACREWPREKEVPTIKGNLVVIDACAGAGGKTLALADAMLGKGSVYAYDVSEKKLDALRKRATRANLFNIKTAKVEDQGEALADKFKEKADVVLVDAPCSGWGVLRRNPDVKWRQKFDELFQLEELQLRLLGNYAKLVKPGGLLTYGVCTFRKKETTDQVDKFLETNPEFTSVGGGFFGPGPSDGFFFHAFRKNGGKAIPVATTEKKVGKRK
jgi:16S rRNA C967 or C1407 C5-methylase (RsmB/RsmF family)